MVQFLDSVAVHPNKPVDLETFGYSVAVSGETLLVGAVANGGGKGAAYVLVRDPKTLLWKEQAKLLPKTSSMGDTFGATVGLDGDWAVVGSTVGVVSIFQRTGTKWKLHTTLEHSAFGTTNDFGRYTSLSGECAVTSGILEDTGERNAFVFLWNGTTWELETTFALGGAGSNVRIHGNRVIASGGGSSIFRRTATGWTLAKGGLPGRVGTLSEHFAATGEVDSTLSPGHAYLFVHKNGAWSSDGTLTAPAQFGMDVALNANRLLVARLDPLGPIQHAYLYRRGKTKWVWTAVMIPSSIPFDPRTNWFGWAAALSERYAVVSAWLANGGKGLVYVSDLKAPKTIDPADVDATLSVTVLVGLIGGGDGWIVVNGHFKHIEGDPLPDKNLLPIGTWVIAYRGAAGKRAMLERFERLGKKTRWQRTASVESVMKKGSTTFLVTPKDEKRALAWLRARRLEIDAQRRAPIVLLVAQGGAAHRALTR